MCEETDVNVRALQLAYRQAPRRDALGGFALVRSCWAIGAEPAVASLLRMTRAPVSCPGSTTEFYQAKFRALGAF